MPNSVCTSLEVAPTFQPTGSSLQSSVAIRCIW